MMQQPPPKSGMPGWLIGLLVALLLIILLVAVMAVLAMVGVRKYIGAAKTTEAMAGVREMAADAQTAFDEDMKLCDSASAPVPPSIALVSGRKWMSSPSDWDTDSAKHAGFACLKFQQFVPQYYQYDYKRTGDAFTAIARGDLDGDGVTSEFSLSGRVVGTTLMVDPTATQKNPTE